MEYTKYEHARIVGARALQISMGAPVLIDDDSGDPIDIAMRELELGVLPITVKRSVSRLLPQRSEPLGIKESRAMSMAEEPAAEEKAPSKPKRAKKKR
ncbi:MAG TPA: DNA-directed RNA polymerase subunit K [Candidatus Methanoperedenaceae archaeon]|nr:DNA-directed RNA polymerase subunit K [Candidatus Methanoperedenaceae archaeon]